MSDKFTCIEEVTKIVKLTIPYLYNKNEINGICDVLEKWKRQYVQQVQGIVVGYKNVSLTSKRGYVKADVPVIHCFVKATFELFHPIVGSIVKGKIKRVSHDHIGCLVHNTINVTLHRTAEIPSDISKHIALERFILFEISRISLSHKFIHMKGKITEECITLMKQSNFFNDDIDVSGNDGLAYRSLDLSSNRNTSNTDDVSSDSSMQNFSSELVDASSQVLSHTKKKKSKKSKDSLLTSPSLFDESVDTDINENESAQLLDPTAKKKKHKKSKFETASNETTNNVNVDITDDIDQNSSPFYLSPMTINEIEPTQSLVTTSRKKHKKSRSREMMDTTNDIESMLGIKEEVGSNSSQVCLSPVEINEIEPTQLPNTTSKEMHNKSKMEFALRQILNNVNITDSTFNIKDEINTDSSNIQSSEKSQKKKKSKKSANVSPEESTALNSPLGQQNSVEKCNNLSSPLKKKKLKKSHHDTFESSCSSLEKPPKKKHKKSKSETSSKKPENNLNYLLNINKTDVDSSNNHLSFIKSEEDSEIFNSHMSEDFNSFMSLLENQNDKNSLTDRKILDVTKQTKKRKRESSDIDCVPKKKKKIEKSSSSKNKDKSHKKRKGDKSSKDTKKNKKKKSKDKVLSTKKRQKGYNSKLKKKNKEKEKKTKIPKKSKSDKQK